MSESDEGEANRRPLTPEQCRAARALLNWSHLELANAASVSKNTVYHFENGRHSPRASTPLLLRLAFEKNGVEFLDNGRGPGVRLVKQE